MLHARRGVLVMAAFFSFLAALGVTPTSGQEVETPPEAPAEKPADVVGELRPFLKAEPAAEDCKALATKAAEGDEEAKKAVLAARLTYVSALCEVSGKYKRPSRELAHECLRQDVQWVRAMQDFEALLLGPDCDAVFAAYQALKPRFRHAGAALAKVVHHAWRCGNLEAMAAAARLEPGDYWVKVALAYTGVNIAPKEAVEILLEAAPNVIAFAKFALEFEPSQFAPANKRPPVSTGDSNFANYQECFSNTVLNWIWDLPFEWYTKRFTEHMGALALNADDAEYVRELEKRLAKALGKAEPSTQATLLKGFNAIAITAVGPQPKREWFEWAEIASFCGGPAMAGFGLYSTPPYCDAHDDRTAGAVVSYMSEPGIGYLQRVVLSFGVRAGDDVLALLAPRAVIVLDEDSLDAYRNIARSFMRFGESYKKQLRAYATALEATKVADLVEIARIITAGKWEELDKRKGARISLTPSQKGSLLAAFADEREVRAAGGLEHLYYADRAVFCDGCRRVHQALGAHIELLKLVANSKDVCARNTAFFRFADFRRRNFAPAAWPRLDGMLKVLDKDGGTALRDFLAGFEAGDESVCLLETGRLALAEAGKPIDSRLRRLLSDGANRWGGLAPGLAAAAAFADRDYVSRVNLMRQAEALAPTDFDVHYHYGPRDQDIGTFSGANWEVVARITMRMLLLRPFCMESIAYATTFVMRRGVGLALPIALYSISIHRCMALLSHWRAVTPAQYALYKMLNVLGFMRRMSVVSAPIASDSREADIRKFVSTVAYGENRWWPIAWLALFGCRVFNGDLAAVEYCNTLDMNDVNNLLNAAMQTCNLSPKRAIDWVVKADDLGVSGYGRFVGTQTLCFAHGKQGQMSSVLERYKEMRGGRNGRPEYLDLYLLSGILAGNKHETLPKAIEAVSKFELSKGGEFSFVWRRAHMAAGLHDKLADIPNIAVDRAPEYSGNFEYSRLFHEARALLDKGDFDELAARTAPYVELNVEDGMGVYLDAALLRALAAKEAGADFGWKEGSRSIKVVDEKFVAFFDATDRYIDNSLLRILAGTRTVDQLALMNELHREGAFDGFLWQGLAFSERPKAHCGSGVASVDEMSAHDAYVHALLLYLIGDNNQGKAWVDYCLSFNQRGSHEYHVIQWLLENRFREKKEEKKEDEKDG
ncbi:MAG: hypothetical protein IT462_11740 [Planctomycetes bacterium]|nr:hypothetical protein [Planctomycetota bacterium]